MPTAVSWILNSSFPSSGPGSFTPSAVFHPKKVEETCKSSHVENSAPEEEGTSDYRHVVLVLRPPPVPSPPEWSHPAAEGSTQLHCQVTPSGLSEQFMPSTDQFAPPNAVEDLVRRRIKTPPRQQHSQEPLRPYPHSQATSAMKAEVEELRMLLAQARGQNSTLTSLDLCSKELEASCQSLAEAIEVELPEPSSENLVTHFHIVQSEVVVTRETSRKQKQEIMELRKQVANIEQCSFDAYARTMRQ
ncbi:hypothetical protein GG344DRAFT_84190 [Lentinula edodes]|nr:hypothetical protein GG344DRAFT_84190 [Lentinula edodes]